MLSEFGVVFEKVAWVLTGLGLEGQGVCCRGCMVEGTFKVGFLEKFWGVESM